MTTVAFVQARLGSRRLPRKSFIHLGRSQLFVHACRAAIAAGLPTYLLVPHCDRSEFEHVNRYVYYNSGRHLDVSVLSYDHVDNDDVTSRFVAAALEIRPKTIVRLTADCPLLFPDLIRDVVDCHEARPPADEEVITTNVMYHPVTGLSMTNVPDGFDVEVFQTTHLIDSAIRMGPKDPRREHVTAEMRSRDYGVSIARQKIFDAAGNFVSPDSKYSIDMMEDFIRVSTRWDELSRCRLESGSS